MDMLISIVFLLLSLVGYSRDRKFVNPTFVMPFVWGCLIFLFSVLPHSLFDLQSQFFLAVSLWVICFTFASFVFQLGSPNVNNFTTSIYNRKVFTVYYYIVLLFGPFALFTLVVEALKVGPEMFLLKLRMINTGLDEDDTFSLGPLSYVFNIATIVCLLFTFYYDRISKRRYYTILSIAFLLGLITLARTSLVTLLISIVVILYAKKSLKRRHYFYLTLVFLGFIMLVTILRESNSSNSAAFSETFSNYVFGGMPAFDTVTYSPTHEVGSNTFRFFYALFNAFGANYQVPPTIYSYVSVPVKTNVYTTLYPFYIDFGYIGVGVVALFYGGIFGKVYQKFKDNNDLFILIYSVIFPILLLQFMGDYLLMNLSTYLQYLIILLIPKILKTRK